MLPLRSRVLTSGLVTLAALTTWACSTSTAPDLPVGANPEFAGDSVGAGGSIIVPVNGLLQCSPLRGQVRERTIGPNGGDIRTSHYGLLVPAGALSGAVSIRMEQISGPINSVRFSPAGLQFAKPVRLAMSYSNCGPNPSGTPNRIAYVDEALQVLELPVSRDDQDGDRVVAQIDHFSRYAVAW